MTDADTTATVTEVLKLLPLGLSLLGAPAALVAALTTAEGPLAQMVTSLLEKQRAGEPLPTLLVPADPRDVELVSARLGLSPAAQTLPPEAVKTEPQVSLDGEPAMAWGPSEAPTKADS